MSACPARNARWSAPDIKVAARSPTCARPACRAPGSRSTASRSGVRGRPAGSECVAMSSLAARTHLAAPAHGDALGRAVAFSHGGTVPTASYSSLPSATAARSRGSGAPDAVMPARRRWSSSTLVCSASARSASRKSSMARFANSLRSRGKFCTHITPPVMPIAARSIRSPYVAGALTTRPRSPWPARTRATPAPAPPAAPPAPGHPARTPARSRGAQPRRAGRR